jgi:hypothetical protein
MVDRICFINNVTLSDVENATNPIPTGTETGLFQPFLAQHFYPLYHGGIREIGPLPPQSEWKSHDSHFFKDDFYYRIHLMPSQIDVGNLTEKVVYDVEIFNAWLTNVTLDTITPQDTEGISLSPLSLPALIRALTSIVIELTVSMDGPAKINGSYTFGYSIGDEQILLVSGSRIVTFSIPPNWGQKVSEKLSFWTDVLESRDGTEQRITMRNQPRWAMEYSILESGDNVNLTDSLLTGWGSRTFAVPVWWGKARLLQPALAEETQIYCDTTNKGFKNGDLAVIWANSQNCETLEVDTVGPGQITFKVPLSHDYMTGFCIPARLCHLVGNSCSVKTFATNLIEADLKFEADAPDDTLPVDFTDKYEGKTIQPFKHDYKSARVRGLTWSLNIYDTGLGIPSWTDRRGYPLDSFEFKDLLFGTLEEITKYKGWLVQNSGKAKSFYVYVKEDQIRLSRRADMGSTMLYIANSAYGLLESMLHDRKTLVMRTRFNTDRLIFKVNSYMSTEQGDVVLFTDTAWPRTYEPGDITQIGFLVLVRFDQDEFEIVRSLDIIARTSFKLKGVIN